MGLRSYIAMRIVLMIPMIILLISIVFLIVRVLPGDPVLLFFEKKATEAQYAAMRQALGLDVPIWVQYVNYLVGFFTGNLGKSMQQPFPPVSQQIFSAFPATLELAIYAIIVAVLIGVLLGSRSAESYNKPIDHAFRISGIISYSVPVFFLGMIFQLIFAVGLHIFPTGGRGNEPQGLNVPLSMPGVGFALGFMLPSLVTVVPFAISFLAIRKWQTTPKSVDLLFVFTGFLASSILYAILTIFVPGILAAPFVALIPLIFVIILLTRKRTKLRMSILQILLPVYVVSLLLYGMVSSLMPLLLLSYLVGLVPARIFLGSIKKKKTELEKRDLLGSLPVVFTVWFQVILTAFLASALLSGLTGDLVAPVLSSYLVALLISFIFLEILMKRKQGIQARTLLGTFLVLPIVWFIFVLGAGSSILSGGLHLKTGLYTVDSILEGSIYDFVQSISYLFLPALTLGIVLSGVFLRLTRTNMIETLKLDYVTAAKARGLRRSTVTYGYALRNAFLPVLTMIGLQFAALLGGAVLTETTFSWPGLGRYIVQCINARDYTAIQGSVVIFGVLVMIVSLVVDLLYAYLDPRIRL